MAEARGKIVASEFTDDERKFLEAIKRTQAQVNPPEGMNVDVGAIAAKAFASYLKGMETEETGDLEWESATQRAFAFQSVELRKVLSQTTSGFTKAVGELLQKEAVEPAVEFRRDFFYTVIPTTVLLFVGGVYLFLRSKVDLPYGPLASALLILTIAAAGGLAVGFLKNPTVFSSHIGSLKHSGGALVGGLFVAAIGLLLGTYGFAQKVQWQQSLNSARIESASRDLAEVGFSTVGQMNGSSLEAKTLMNFGGTDNAGTFVVETEKNGDAVKVEAKPSDAPTSVVLHIEPKKADVYSTSSTLPDYQILTGRVSSISDDFVELTPDVSTDSLPVKITLVAGGSDQLKHANWIAFKEANIEKLKGEEVKVLFEPRTSKGLKMSLFQSGTESVIYNSALSNVTVKTSAAIAP